MTCPPSPAAGRNHATQILKEFRPSPKDPEAQLATTQLAVPIDLASRAEVVAAAQVAAPQLAAPLGPAGPPSWHTAATECQRSFPAVCQLAIHVSPPRGSKSSCSLSSHPDLCLRTCPLPSCLPCKPLPCKP